MRESGCAGVWDSERGSVFEIVREIKRVCVCVRMGESEIEEKFLKASHAVDNFRSIEVRPIFFKNLNQFDYWLYK